MVIFGVMEGEKNVRPLMFLAAGSRGMWASARKEAQLVGDMSGEAEKWENKILRGSMQAEF